MIHSLCDINIILEQELLQPLTWFHYLTEIHMKKFTEQKSQRAVCRLVVTRGFNDRFASKNGNEITALSRLRQGEGNTDHRLNQ